MNYSPALKASGLTLAFLLASALAGCATLYEGKYDFSEGWREAEVLEVVPLSGIGRPNFYTCVRNASASEKQADTQYVILKYRRMSRSARHAQPLQTGQQWTPGEKVYVKVSDCTGQIVRRSQ